MELIQCIIKQDERGKGEKGKRGRANVCSFRPFSHITDHIISYHIYHMDKKKGYIDRKEEEEEEERGGGGVVWCGRAGSNTRWSSSIVTVFFSFRFMMLVKSFLASSLNLTSDAFILLFFSPCDDGVLLHRRPVHGFMIYKIQGTRR